MPSFDINQAAKILAQSTLDSLKELGREAKVDAVQLEAYAATRLTNAQGDVGTPSFLDTTRIEADNMLAEATHSTFDLADSADAKAWGQVRGVITALIAALTVA